MGKGKPKKMETPIISTKSDYPYGVYESVVCRVVPYDVHECIMIFL